VKVIHLMRDLLRRHRVGILGTVFFIQGEEFQCFGKCIINVPGVVIAQPHSKSHHRSSK